MVGSGIFHPEVWTLVVRMMMMIMVVTKGVAEDGRSNGPGHWI